MPVKVVTDSVSDISPAIAGELGINPILGANVGPRVIGVAVLGDK